MKMQKRGVKKRKTKNREKVTESNQHITIQDAEMTGSDRAMQFDN